MSLKAARNLSLVVLVALWFLATAVTPVRADGCGSLQPGGECGTSGYFTAYWSGVSDCSGDPSDDLLCAEIYCMQECSGGLVIGDELDQDCTSNPYGSWIGFKCTEPN
jgi:hypothetical protein